MQESDKPRLRRRLEEAGMINVITEMKEEARAAGLAAGLAEGRAEALAQSSRATVASLHRLMERGVLTRDAVRAELQELMDAGGIAREIGQEALSQLGERAVIAFEGRILCRCRAGLQPSALGTVSGWS
jgi:hypothetical protein